MNIGTTYFHGGSKEGDEDIGLGEYRGERELGRNKTDPDQVCVSFRKEKKAQLLL